MSILNRRLLRSIKKNKMQFVAMTLIVLVGISMYVGLTGTYASLLYSQTSLYEDNKLSGHTFMVVNAPAEITRRIGEVAGVDMVEGRSQQDVKLVTEDGSRAQVRLTGYSTDKEQALHYPYLTLGKYPAAEAGNTALDALADTAFVKANNIKEGDEVYTIVGGKQVRLNIVGAAVSPEYIYIVKDASNLFSDPKTFGIVFLPENQLAAILGKSGQISQILVMWTEGDSAANADSVEAIKEILEPYGLVGDMARDDYPSHSLLKMEIDNLKVMATTFPFIFLSVAAMVEIIILRRTINAQRLNIGILKSQGFSNFSIQMSFANYAILVTAIGTILGIVAGYGIGIAFTAFYGLYFNLPYTLNIVSDTSIIGSLIIGPAIGFVSGILATRRIIHIQAAEAMRAEPPKDGKTIAIEEFKFLWNRMSAQWKMAARSVGRNVGRFFVVTLGMICTTALLLLSFYMNDAVDFMLGSYFDEDIKYDYIVRFDGSVHQRDLEYFNELGQVTYAEPFVETSVTLTKGGKEQDDSIMGMIPDTAFKDIKDKNMAAIALPEDGLILSNVIAGKLGAHVGDIVKVRIEPQPGAVKYMDLPVAAIHQQMMGYKTICSLKQAGYMMGDPGMASGVMLNVQGENLEALEMTLDDIPKVASWSSKAKEIAAATQMMAIMPSMITIMVSLSLVLGFAVLYNTGVVNLAERRNEIATLRTIGFTVGEVRGILFKETLLQSIVGYIAGLPLGYLMIKNYIGSMESDMYTFPVIIHCQSYVYAAIPAFALIFIVSRMTTRSLKDMDLVEVTRIRE